MPVLKRQVEDQAKAHTFAVALENVLDEVTNSGRISIEPTELAKWIAWIAKRAFQDYLHTVEGIPGISAPISEQAKRLDLQREMAAYLESLGNRGSNDCPTEPEQSLAVWQYDEAQKYPGEHVVFIGRRIYFHGRDEEEAVRHWRLAWAEAGNEMPAINSPDTPDPRWPIIVRSRIR